MKRKLIALACIATIGLGANSLTASASQNLSATSGSIAINDTTPNPHVEVDAGGGKWNYGSTLTVALKKKTHSNYFHETKKHGSSAKVGDSAKWTYSGDTKSSTWSKASATGDKNSTGYAKWNYVK